MSVGRHWLGCFAVSAAAHGAAFVGLSRAAREEPPHDRPPITMSIEILSPVLSPPPPPRRAAHPLVSDAVPEAPPPASSPALLDAVAPEAVAVPGAPAAGTESGLALGLGVGDSASGPSGVILGAGAGVEGGQGAGVATDTACWADIDRDLQARARSRVPRALQQRGLVGRATVRLMLDDQGRARDIRFEDLEGSPLIPDAVRAILAEPFAHTCAGETRWRVRFELRRT